MTDQNLDYWVYIVRCSDDSYYTGIARDIKTRLTEHNSGTGAKYTSARRPVQLVYSERQASRSVALKREYQIKQLTRQQKKELIK